LPAIKFWVLAARIGTIQQNRGPENLTKIICFSRSLFITFITFILCGIITSVLFAKYLLDRGLLTQIINEDKTIYKPYWHFSQCFQLIPCTLNTVLLIDTYRRMWKVGTIRKWKMICHICGVIFAMIAEYSTCFWTDNVITMLTDYTKYMEV
jgi:hypothetical protein